ncbi:MAG: methyl-accepting chemotaxis protein [bacterium]
MNLRDKVLRQAARQPAIFAAVTILIVLFFSILNQQTINRENRIKAASAEANYNELKMTAKAYAGMIASYESVQRGVAEDKRYLVTAVISPLFKNTKVGFITVHEIDGYVLARAHRPDDFSQDESGMQFVKRALKGLSTNAITLVDGRPALISTVPIAFNSSNTGAVTVGYFLDDEFARRLSDLSGAEIMIARNDKVLANSLAEQEKTPGKKAVGRRLIAKKYLPEKIDTKQGKIRVRGIRYDLTHQPLQGSGGYSLIIASNNNTMRMILALLFIGCVVVTILMFLNAKRTSRLFADDLAAPIMRVAEHADKVAHGKLDVEPLKIETDDEVGRLSQSFNVMVANLREMVEKDKTQREYLEAQVAKLTEKIDAAANGDFTVRFDDAQEDAFGRIGGSLNTMIADLDSMIARDKEQRKYLEEKVAELLEIIQAAAAGDFTKYYQGSADDDIGRLGVALSKMIVDLQSMLEMNKSRRSYLEGQVGNILRVIEAASRGDFSMQFEIKRNDEIGRVGVALNQMTADLKIKIEQIEAMKQKDREQKENLELQIREILLKVAQAANGDLTAQLPLEKDEQGIIADLKKNLNFMFNRLRALVAKVRESSQAVDKTSRSIREITDRLQAGAARQSESVKGTAKFIDGMASSIETVVEHAKDMMRLSGQTNEDASSGGETTRQAVSGMKQVGEAMEDIKLVMVDLENSAEEIDGIVKAIDEISDQTNLLALNAAIEAARAGEYGRGFSVVAKEISSLAGKSVISTREITNIVRRIQERVKKAMESTERGHYRATEGTELADKAGTALDQIMTSIGGVTVLIKETSEAIEKRRGEISHIHVSMKDIRKISEETSTLAVHAAEAVQTLSALSNELEAFVGQINIGK